MGERKQRRRTYTNAFFYRVVIFYVCIVLIMGGMIISISFAREYGKTVSRQEMVMSELEYIYKSKTN